MAKAECKICPGRTILLKDFDLYFEKIFNSDFIKALMKIKADKLFNDHHSESTVFTVKDCTYQMLADVQRVDTGILYLNMSFGNNGVDDYGEKSR